jgi:hypothetical protein
MVASTFPVHDGTVFTSSVVVGLSSSPVSVSSSTSVSPVFVTAGPSPGSLSDFVVETDPVDLILVGAAVDPVLLTTTLDVNEMSSPSLTGDESLVHVHLSVGEVIGRAAPSLGASSLGSNDKGRNSGSDSHNLGLIYLIIRCN